MLKDRKCGRPLSVFRFLDTLFTTNLWTGNFDNGYGLCKCKSRFSCSSDQKNCSHQVKLFGITCSYSSLRICSILSSLGYGKREFNSETEVGN